MEVCLKMLQLLPDIPDLSRAELSHLINELDKENKDIAMLTETTTDCVVNSLLKYPYETYIFLNQIENTYCKNSDLTCTIASLYANSLCLCMDQLNCTDNGCLRTLYFLLSKLKVIDDNAMSTLCSLISENMLDRELVYFSLLANKDSSLLEKLVGYERNALRLCTANPISLFECVVYKNRHWFSDVIEDAIQTPKLSSSHLKVLQLIHKTNFQSDFADIQKCVSDISSDELPSDLKFVVSGIEHLVQITTLCASSTENHDSNDIYSFACVNSALSALSKYLNLSSKDYWRRVVDLLKMDNAESAIEIFDSFCILCNVLQCVQTCKKRTASAEGGDISQVLIETRDKLLKLDDSELQLELLENVYVLVFLKVDHLLFASDHCSNQRKATEKFLCGEKELRLIVFFIKSCFDGVIKSSDLHTKERLFTLQKHISDAIWRLELLSETVGASKSYFETNEYMNFMLASPKSLVNLCLNNGNFGKAHQVIQIFEMSEEELAQETQFMEDFVQLKDDIKKIFKIKRIQRENPNMKMQCDVCIQSTFKKFESYLFSQMQQSDEELNVDLRKTVTSKMFTIIFDLMITEPKYYEDCIEMLEILESYKDVGLDVKKNQSLYGFYVNLCEIFKISNENTNVSFTNILNSCIYDLNAEAYKKNITKHSSIVKTLDEILLQVRFESKDVPSYEKVSPRTFSQLGDLCQNFSKDHKDRINVFQRLLNYLKTFSQVLTANNDFSKPIISKDNTCFTILNCDRNSVIGTLIYDQSIEPATLEPLFSKLKLDLIYHIASNSFPEIYLLHNSSSSAARNAQNDFKRVPTKDTIAYIQKRNWLLAYLLLQIHNPSDVNFALNAQRTKCFENLLALRKTQRLKQLFLNDNQTLAALQHFVDPRAVLEFYAAAIERFELEELESGPAHWNNRLREQDDRNGDDACEVAEDDLETGEEICEDDEVIKVSKWKRLYDVLDALPDNTLADPAVAELWNAALKNIITECCEPDYYKYVEYIKDDELRIQMILDNFYNWPGEFCVDVLRSVISMENRTSDELRTQLQDWCDKIEVYEQIRHETDCLSWSEIHNICDKAAEDVLKILLETAKVDLLLKFFKIHPLPHETLLAIDTSYFLQTFNANCSLASIEQLLNILPPNQSLGICQQLLKSLQRSEHLQFVVDRLLNHSTIERSHLRKIELSLKIIACFAENEQTLLLRLIGRPFCIFEQLLMNTKLETLAPIVRTCHEYFSSCVEVDEEEEGDRELNVEMLDDLLRRYAEKALDFRVITEPIPILRAESKLMQSFDSLSLGSDKQPFVMPSEVPTKLEWMQNDEALECMCCRQVTFSMFNRRHHCRRCGRLICGNCSLKRLQVASYGDILVRVCNNCYEQSHRSTGTGSSKTESASILLYDNWQLMDDSAHNDIVREEFSYEHAPSVSLCLAILKYHSNDEELPRFLLGQCDKMLHLIQPIHSETHHEIDYSLVIKMIKSLAIASKMISLQCSAKWAIVQSDRVLSQIELLNLLTERGCLELIPHHSPSSSSSSNKGLHIDGGVLRRLRDKLLEREQWSLALEVSTKAGLDRGAVFAAWGKNCLKAGCLNVARDKFRKCFEKGHHFELSTDYNSEMEESLDGRSRQQSKLSTLSSVSESRPLKTPPLVDVIVDMLESKRCVLHEQTLKMHQNTTPKLTITSSTLSLHSLNVPSQLQLQHQQQQQDPAVCIYNKLKSLEAIAAGNYDTYPSAEVVSSADKRRCDVGGVDGGAGAATEHEPREYIEPLFYDECVYYLLKYGSHSSILHFYIKHGAMKECLVHVLDNRLTADAFVDVYLSCLSDGVIEKLQTQMSKMDSSLDVWKSYLKAICRHLEKNAMLNSLYQLQLFMGDYVRAAMTCIKFYTDDANAYAELLNRVNYLHRAQEHLKQDLEQEQWVEVAAVRKSSATSQEIQESYQEKSLSHSSLAMKMDARTIDKHITTIWRQIEVTKILAEYETSQQLTDDCLKQIVKIGTKDDKLIADKTTVPTLFGSQFEKIQIAILLIVCGKNVEDSFGVAFRIAQDYQLKPVSVYCQAGKHLANAENYNGIAQLVSCVRSSGVSDAVVIEMCDEMLILAVHTLTKANSTGPQLDGLIKLITDKAAKISAYIESKQLKSAYLLAVKHKRMGDVRRILKEAESLNQQNIKVLCQKLLQTHSNLPSHSRE